MSKEKNIKEITRKGRISILLFTIIAVITSLFAIYEIFLLSSIEDLIRYIVIGVLFITDIIFIIKTKNIFKKKKKKEELVI